MPSKMVFTGFHSTVLFVAITINHHQELTLKASRPITVGNDALIS